MLELIESCTEQGIELEVSCQKVQHDLRGRADNLRAQLQDVRYETQDHLFAIFGSESTFFTPTKLFPGGTCGFEQSYDLGSFSFSLLWVATNT